MLRFLENHVQFGEMRRGNQIGNIKMWITSYYGRPYNEMGPSEIDLSSDGMRGHPLLGNRGNPTQLPIIPMMSAIRV